MDAPSTIVKYKTFKYYYDTNPEFKERVKAQLRENYRKRKDKDPETERKRTRDINKNKYDNNPEYREKKKADALARYYAKKALRNAQNAS